jgi:hypothetical protein
MEGTGLVLLHLPPISRITARIAWRRPDHEKTQRRRRRRPRP